MTTITEVESPPANRLRRPRWLDLRLLVGLILVLGSIAVGARVVAAADQTVPVLVASADLAAGQPLTDDVLETRQVQLSDVASHYFAGTVGEGYVAVRPVSRGELLPRSAVAEAEQVGELRYVTLPLASAEAPAGLRAGAMVDVWRTSPTDDGGMAATRLAERVSVTGTASGSGTFGDTSGHTQVTLALTAADEGLDELTAQVVAAARSGDVYLTKLPDAAS